MYILYDSGYLRLFDLIEKRFSTVYNGINQINYLKCDGPYTIFAKYDGTVEFRSAIGNIQYSVLGKL
jgi:tRNA splicing ligase